MQGLDEQFLLEIKLRLKFLFDITQTNLAKVYLSTTTMHYLGRAKNTPWRIIE